MLYWPGGNTDLLDNGREAYRSMRCERISNARGFVTSRHFPPSFSCGAHRSYPKIPSGQVIMLFGLLISYVIRYKKTFSIPYILIKPDYVDTLRFRPPTHIFLLRR